MKKHFLFLSALALFLSSCEIFSSLSEKTGAISIKMPEGSERIAETYDVNEITSFSAELYNSGSSPVAKVSSAPGKSITFESLTPGSYAIVIKAFISEECAGYAEKSGIVVEAGATTYETITLFKNIIKNIESVEIAKESLDKITKNYTVGQTFALPDNVSIIAHFIHGYEKELEPNDYEIYICNAEKYTEETLVENQPLSENSRFAVIGICTESGYKYSAPVSLVMNAEEPFVTWTIPTVKDNTISFTISATASGEISYTWYKANTADMAEKTDCTSEINMAEDGTVALPLKDESGAYVYYVCTVTNTNSAVNGTKTASKQTAVFSSQMENFTVTFDLNYDGSKITTQSVTDGATVKEPDTPTREGYTFAGWYTDTECTVEYNFSEVVTENITLYAKWIEVITDWETLYTKLNDKSEDLGNVYVMGDFFVTVNKIIFYGTANIVSTGIGATFTRGTDFTDDFFYLNPKSLTFKGSESAPIVFDGNSETQTSNLITNGGTTTFEYCSFKNNSSSNYASVYLMDGYNTSKTTFKSCTFTGNTGYKGGAVYVGEKDTVSFENCTFETNTASDCGGAVYIKAEATGTFSNCTFKSNTASYYGGAVYIESTGTGSFSDCKFEGNSANTRGGAIDSSGTADITKCTFTSNSAKSDTGYGGAINIDSGTMTISSITCSGNTATTGKDIYHSNGTLNIGGTVDGSIDIYMYNNSSSPVLVPVKGITLADETYPINVEMYKCSAETTVLTQSEGMTTFDFAAAINCFTLTNNGFAIGSNGTAVTQ